MVKKTRHKEAMKNLKKAAEYGSTFWDNSLPAIKVPPQKKAVNRSFI